MHPKMAGLQFQTKRLCRLLVNATHLESLKLQHERVLLSAQRLHRRLLVNATHLEPLKLQDERVLFGAQRLYRRLLVNETLSETVQSVLQLGLTRAAHTARHQLQQRNVTRVNAASTAGMNRHKNKRGTTAGTNRHKSKRGTTAGTHHLKCNARIVQLRILFLIC